MASTLFSNAKHTHITGGQFSVIQHNIKQITVSLKGLDLLHEYCALGAIHDSSERFDPPRCSEETRAAIIEEILAWIYGHDESASMVWLYGGAGAGKSALAQTIAEICQKEGRLAGSFFFSRTSTADRSDGNRLIPTLVFQLLEAFPNLKPHVEESINMHTGIFDRSPKTQMGLLVIKPLTAFKRQAMSGQISPSSSVVPMTTPSVQAAAPKSKSSRHRFSKVFGKLVNRDPRIPNNSPPQPEILITHSSSAAIPSEFSDPSQPHLIVIDGLDECNGEDVQIELLRVLASAIPHLPFPLRILIASRPEGGITRTINYDKSFLGLNLRKIDLSDDANADNDIRKFLTTEFQEIHRTHPLKSLLNPSWPPKGAIAILVQKSSSHFIYASTVIKYIQYSRGRPDKRLEVILGLSIPPTADKPFAQLDVLYTHIFMSIDEIDRKAINHVFSLLHLASQNTLDYSIGTSPAELEDYLSMEPGEINLLFEPLASLVALPADREDRIKMLHASLFDFLLDRTRSGTLCLKPKMAHGLLADYWLEYAQTYAFDGTQLRVILRREFIEPVDVCWRFLSHCHYLARLLDGHRDYLCSFPFLYEVLLHPRFIPNYLAKFNSSGLTFIPLILQTFFTLVVEKNFDNGPHLHFIHTSQIKQSLQLILGDHDARLLEDVAKKPLFNYILYQGRHRVYSALLNVYLSFLGIEYLYRMLDNWKYVPTFKDIKDSVLSHFLVICLPYLSSQHIDLFREYSDLTGYSIDSDDELHCVLRQRYMKYLQRMGGNLLLDFEVDEAAEERRRESESEGRGIRERNGSDGSESEG